LRRRGIAGAFRDPAGFAFVELPPFFDVFLSELSIEIRIDLPEGAQLSARNRELYLEVVYGAQRPIIICAPK
jgi:hypothetical protein